MVRGCLLITLKNGKTEKLKMGLERIERCFLAVAVERLSSVPLIKDGSCEVRLRVLLHQLWELVMAVMLF